MTIRYVDHWCVSNNHSLSCGNYSIIALTLASNNKMEEIELQIYDSKVTRDHKMILMLTLTLMGFFLNCWFIFNSTQYRQYLNLPSLMMGKIHKTPSIPRDKAH